MHNYISNRWNQWLADNQCVNNKLCPNKLFLKYADFCYEKKIRFSLEQWLRIFFSLSRRRLQYGLLQWWAFLCASHIMHFSIVELTISSYPSEEWMTWSCIVDTLLEIQSCFLVLNICTCKPSLCCCCVNIFLSLWKTLVF